MRHTLISIEPEQPFGNLIVLREVERKAGNQFFECLCDCGNVTTVMMGNLRSGDVQSCGCLRKKHRRVDMTRRNQEAATHGYARRDEQGRKSAEYEIWWGIVQRCCDPNAKDYKRYGAVGITICHEWRQSFQAFIAYVGERPSDKHSIDRIKGRLGYQPGNVRWATPKEQSRNRTDNRLVTFQGETKCVAEWAEHLQIKSSILYGRLRTSLYR